MASLPNDLVADIRGGQTLAFVGAGFVAPLVPGWTGLLAGLVAKIPDGGRRTALTRRLQQQSSALDLEAIAQTVRDILGAEFDDSLRMALIGNETARQRVEERLAHLHAMPFKGAVTTNFDDVLRGVGAETPAFVRLIAQVGSPWKPLTEGAILKIHGQVGDARNRVVLTRDDYRTRVHGHADYAAFLKSLIATHPVLFMGTSFTDAYLNELRSEVLSWFASEKHSFPGKPRWWAIMPDVDLDTIKFFKRHEGITVLPYRSGSDHRRFDELLGALRAATSPEAALAARLADAQARILWHDPSPDNNHYGRSVLVKSAFVESTTTIAETVAALTTARSSGAPFTLLISRFGERVGEAPEVVELMETLRTQRIRIPHLVFASATNVDARRRLVRSAGAFDYTCSWEDFFRCIAEFYEDERARRRRLGFD